MNISSRTPEGEDNRCPVCGNALKLEPSRPPGDAPCPFCGTLLWFGGSASQSQLPMQRALPQAFDAPALGAIGDYDLLEMVGGASSAVYKARDRALGRIVALKIVRDFGPIPKEVAERFEREMRALASLNHPNIVRVYDVGHHEGTPYCTMAYIAGGTLAQHLQHKHFCDDPRAAVVLVKKLAGAVHHIHENGMLYRDLKPAHVLIDELGEPQLTGFGLLLAIAHIDLVEAGTIAGTPASMAPEQAVGRFDAIGRGTDIWGLGVILYELLTGKRPFAGLDLAELRRQVVQDQPAPVRSLSPHVDKQLEKIVSRCLQKEPRNRYADAATLAAELGRYLGDN